MPSLGLADSLQGLSVVSTHGNLSDIDVAVGGGNHTEILLADALTLGSELSDSTERGSLRGLATSVRVNLCIEHEDVDVLTRSEKGIETKVISLYIYSLS